MAADFCPLKDQPGSSSAVGENPEGESLDSASQWSSLLWGALILPLGKADRPLASGTTPLPPRGQRRPGVLFPPTEHLNIAVSFSKNMGRELGSRRTQVYLSGLELCNHRGSKVNSFLKKQLGQKDVNSFCRWEFWEAPLLGVACKRLIRKSP